MFVVDRENYSLFTTGEPFNAHHVSDSVNQVTVDIPLNSSQGWYLVLSNKESVATYSVGELSVTLSSDEETWSGPSLNERIHLLPGKSIAVQLTAAP